MSIDESPHLRVRVRWRSLKLFAVYRQHFDFWTKFRFLAKILIFELNFDFSQNFDFWTKFRFLAKILIFELNFDFSHNLFGWLCRRNVKIEIVYGMWPNFEHIDVIVRIIMTFWYNSNINSTFCRNCKNN